MVAPSLSTTFSSAGSGHKPASPTNKATVQVVVRVRPLNEREKKHGTLPVVSASTSDKTVTIIKGSGSRQVKSSYKFDNVFTSFSTQEDVFEATLQPIIKDVLMGYESTVFAYGQTGTGKTHTMEGNLKNTQDHGVIPRSAVAIFDALEKDPDCIASNIHCSLLEIYNEELCDLLVDPSTSKSSKTKLAIMEGENGPFCRGLSERIVESPKDLFSLMQTAHKQRQTGETDMNKESSRSHCIFTLRVEAKRRLVDGSVLDVTGKLHCVDLAGSECAKACGNAGKQQAARERERMNINRSLLTLGRVVKLLKEKSQGSRNANVRIPYRDSKLTRILQESLGGRCKTCLIATISPSVTAIEESMSTLNYAQAANGIINKPVTTSLMNVSGMDSTGPKSLSEAGGSVEHWHEMECRLEYMRSQVEEAQQALARKHIQQQELVERAEQAEHEQKLAERNLEKAQHDISVLESKVEDVSQKLQDTEKSLLETKIVLKATQETEEALTGEAKALIGVVKRTIADGDCMHEQLVQNRQDEIDRKTVTSEFQIQQSKLLQQIIGQLDSIRSSFENHRARLDDAKANEDTAHTTLLKDHESIIQRMRQDCVSELNLLSQSIQDGLVPKVGGFVKSLQKNLNELSEALKQGDEWFSSECEAILNRLVEKSARMIDMETGFRSSSESVLNGLSSRVEVTKETLTKAVEDMISVLKTSQENRQLQRNQSKKAIDAFYMTSNNYIAMIQTQSDDHASVLREECKTHKDAEPRRQTILESVESTGKFILKEQEEYIRKLEDQCAILSKQKEELVMSKQKQKEMNKAMMSKIMSGIQSLLEDEMESIDRFQSSTVESILASHDACVESNTTITESLSQTFDHLATARDRLEQDIQDDFEAQERLFGIIEAEATSFQNSTRTLTGDIRTDFGAFLEDSKSTLETVASEDETTTRSLMDSLEQSIEKSTKDSLSNVQQYAKEGMTNLQEANANGWKCVKDEIVDPTRQTVAETILPEQLRLHRSVNEMVASLKSKMVEKQKSVLDDFQKEAERISSIEQAVDEAVSKSFNKSIEKHLNSIQNSDWLKTGTKSQAEMLSTQSDAAERSAQDCETMLRDHTTNVHRVQEMPMDVPERTVPSYTEKLSFTKKLEDLLAATTHGSNSDAEENSKENNVVEPKRGKAMFKMGVLKERNTLASNDSPPLKRIAEKTGIPNGRKRTKRSKI